MTTIDNSPYNRHNASLWQALKDTYTIYTHFRETTHTGVKMSIMDSLKGALQHSALLNTRPPWFNNLRADAKASYLERTAAYRAAHPV